MRPPLVFDLPFQPSLNNAYVNVPGVGRVKSSRSKAWFREAGWVVRAATGPILGKIWPTERVAVEIELERRSGRRPDIDNVIKPILDLFQDMNIYGNDNQVDRIVIGYGPVTGVRVTVSVLTPA